MDVVCQSTPKAEDKVEVIHIAQSTTKLLNTAQSRLHTHPQWLHAVRKLLASLSKGFARREELLSLNIAVSELLSSPVAAPSAAVTAHIDTFFQSRTYQKSTVGQGLMDWPEKIQKWPESVSSCYSGTSCMINNWVLAIREQADVQVEVLSQYRLHITGDSRTDGVPSMPTMIARQDAYRRPLLSFVRRDVAMEKGLTCVELYALLAAAAKKYLAQPLVEDTLIYQTEIFSTYAYWTQQITACIPASYIRSMLEGQQQLIGNIDICRGPCLDLHDITGRSLIIRRVFEYCELQARNPPSTWGSELSAAPNSKEQIGMVKNVKKVGRRRKRETSRNYVISKFRNF